MSDLSSKAAAQVRDLLKTGFTAEDFQSSCEDGDCDFSDYDATLIAQKANAIFTAWLEGQPKVYGCPERNNVWLAGDVANVQQPEGTHTARLIDVRPLAESAVAITELEKKG